MRHPPTTGISVLPYLEISKPRKTPNLNRFYKKRKNWVYLIKNWNDMFGNWSISTRDLLPSKIMNFKKYTLFIKLPLLLNLTQFYIPSHNSNLKMNLYEKLHFFMFYLDHQDNGKTLNNFFWTRIFLQIYTQQNE